MSTRESNQGYCPLFCYSSLQSAWEHSKPWEMSSSEIASQVICYLWLEQNRSNCSPLPRKPVSCMIWERKVVITGKNSRPHSDSNWVLLGDKSFHYCNLSFGRRSSLQLKTMTDTSKKKVQIHKDVFLFLSKTCMSFVLWFILELFSLRIKEAVLLKLFVKKLK